MTHTEKIGEGYFISCGIDGQRASVCLLDPPDTAETVINAIQTRMRLIRQYATDISVLQQRLQELTEQ